LEYAFNTLDLRKVCASVYDFNPRSKRCMEKCGYHQEGVRKQHIFRNGRLVDEILMAVFKDDFIKVWEVYKKKFLGKK
jgi:RimJ/RimL family protein N-acetyltransferase